MSKRRGFYVDADHGAGHDRWLVVVGPVSAAPEFGVQAVPGLDVDGPVARVLGAEFGIGDWPGRRVGAAEPVAVTAGPPHGPSGKKTANSAWLAHAIMAFNLARAAAVLAGPRHARTRWATIRTQLINVPARVATSSRRLTLHLPTDWPWADSWQAMFDAAAGPPPVTT